MPSSDDAVVCVRASSALDVLGSERRDCADCGTDVQVPERVRDAAAVVCLACAVERTQQEVPIA